MVSRYLVTTAIEETWPDAPVLFLGEWCRLYSRKGYWAKMDFELLPYHWDDREKLYRDYLYLRDFYERMLPVIGGKLNEIHGVDHSTRYWRILIGPWLGYFLQMLFDRWTSIQQAVASYEISGSTILDFPEEAMIPQSMSGFRDCFLSDEWNHHIYAIILREIGKIGIEVKSVAASFPSSKIRLSHKTLLKQRLKTQLVSVCSRVLSCLGGDEDAVFIATYLPYLRQWHLDWKFRQIPQVRRFVPIPPATIDLQKRDWLVELESESDFERFASQILARQIPAAYLEGYASLVRQAGSNCWPKRPKLIWTSNSENSDDHFKAYTAEKIEQGVPLVIGQHGGHYGVGLWSFTEDHHLAIADRYFSWGWTESQHSNIRPMGQLIHKQPLRGDHGKKERLLLVTAALPRYSYHMYSVLVARQWLDYLEDQFTFCQALPPELRKALKVRLFPSDYGWEQKKRWKDRLPSVTLADRQRPMDELIRECRLYVATYNATTYLESFAMNVPTVIFWNPAQWELRDSARPYFDILKQVGVLHETPESAARHIAKVWDRVEDWWASESVTMAVQQICRRYCKKPNHLVNDLFNELSQLADEYPFNIDNGLDRWKVDQYESNKQ